MADPNIVKLESAENPRHDPQLAAHRDHNGRQIHEMPLDLRLLASQPPSGPVPPGPYDQYQYYPHMQVQQAYYPAMRPGMLPPGVHPHQNMNMSQNMNQNMSQGQNMGQNMNNMNPNQNMGQSMGQNMAMGQMPPIEMQLPNKGRSFDKVAFAHKQTLPTQLMSLNSPSTTLEHNEIHAGNSGIAGDMIGVTNDLGSNSTRGNPNVPLGAQNSHPNGPPNGPGIVPSGMPGPDMMPGMPTQAVDSKVKLLRSSLYPRKRSHTACDTCRQKKVKCDNVRPQCGACKRNNIANCRYRTDEPGSDYSGYDPASINILAKLDVILRELRSDEIEKLEGSEPKRRRKQKRVHYFQHCLWDMSLTLVLKWSYLQKVLGTTPDDAAAHQSRLIKDYEVSDHEFPFSSSPVARYELCNAIERLLHHELSTFTNSFLINCHTKVPCIDIITLVESVEIYTLMKRADDNFSFASLLEEFNNLKPTEQVSKLYEAAIARFGIEDTRIRQKLYRNFCESVPLLLIICAIGALATPIRLDNIGTFNNSLEERAAVSIGCYNFDNAGSNLQKNRFQLSQMLVSYALIISSVYPLSLKPNSLVSVEYHILCSQYYQYVMNPLKAHREIVLASTEMMYFLQKESTGTDSSRLPDFVLNGKRLVVDRLFWTCLKLECELRTELSPHVPLSGITQMNPPSPFMKIPDPLLDDDHLSECIRLANKYDDQYSWFFFLTEIAVRKVDNKLFDEVYSAEGAKELLWDQPRFSESTVWNILIKYLNQYNGIISSLSPHIRKFVLLEVNVEQIYAIIKKRADKKKKNDTEEDIFETLDEFLIDDDLLLRAQSESVMFIKTRIVTSKLALFRPLIYLFLEDKILFMEIVEAAADVLPRIQMSQNDQAVLQDQAESPMTGSSSTNNESTDASSNYNSNFANFLGEEASYFDMSNASHVYLERYPDDDFSDLIEYTDGADEFDKDFIQIKDTAAARKRLLRVFIRNFITLPKLNIPKIGLHRHAGSWYYLRNLFLGVVIQFLLFKKVQEAVIALMSAATEAQEKPQTELFEALNAVFSRDVVKASLDHALLIINYWKEERKDCALYGEYLQRCLKNL